MMDVLFYYYFPFSRYNFGLAAYAINVACIDLIYALQICLYSVEFTIAPPKPLAPNRGYLLDIDRKQLPEQFFAIVNSHMMSAFLPGAFSLL